MNQQLIQYQNLSEIFRYPNNDFKLKIDILKNQINTDFPEFKAFISKFSEETEKMNISELEEHYVNTFLLNPISSLDIGFILFGDDSKRNDFLVNVQHEQNKIKNDCFNELADHLPNILTLIYKSEDNIFVEELVFSLLIPAVKEIKSKFDTTDNFYKHAFDLLLTFFVHDFKNCNYLQFEINHKEKKSADFVGCK